MKNKKYNLKEIKEILTIIFFFTLFSMAFFMFLFPGHLVNQSKAIQVVNSSGFSEAKIIEDHRIFSGFFGCTRDDYASFDLQAKDSKNQDVKLIVCCGLLSKGCTIR